MSERAIANNTRLLTLLVVVVIAGALSGSVGMMTYMAAQPDELDLWIVAPWVMGGMLVGLAAWFVLGPAQRRRTYRRGAK